MTYDEAQARAKDPVRSLPEPTRRPAADVLAAYLGKNPRQLFMDVAERPQHYTEDEKRWAAKLQGGEELTPQESGTLLMKFLRSTETESATKQLVRKLTKPDEDGPEDEAPETLEGDIEEDKKDPEGGDDSGPGPTITLI